MPTRLFEMIVSSTGELTASGVILRLALAGCSMFAMVHLLSLWGTKYGDNNTLSKSFFLSLVLHGCVCLGWATVAESYPHRGTGPVERDSVPVPITFIDNVDEAPVKGTSKLPIWNTGAATPDRSLARDPRSRARTDREGDVADVDAPEIDKLAVENAPQEVPEFSTDMDENSPDLAQSASVSPKTVASGEMNVEQPAPDSRPATAAARATTARSNITRPSVPMDVTPRSASKSGTASRITPVYEDGAVMSLPYETESDALPRPQGAPSDDVVRRPGSPSPSDVIDSVAGSGTSGNSNVAGTSNPRITERNSRPIARPGQGTDDATSRPSIPSSRMLSSNQTGTNGSVGDRMLNSRGPIESTSDSPQPVVTKGKTQTMLRAPARAPETYQARSIGQRMSAALKNGGSMESEEAVERSLKWLASVQESDGRWSSARHGGGSSEVDPQDPKVQRPEGGKRADTGVTGLVVLSFLAAGYTHERGPYTAEVGKALDWLIGQQQSDGYLAGEAATYDKNYCHAMATFALAEAYAMQKDANDFPELQRAVRRGVKKITAMQNGDGGWRYRQGGPRDESDMSMFGWQLMALKSGANGGIPVPEETASAMVHFLESRKLGQHGGLAGYKPGHKPTPAMTAEAMFCRQIFAVRTNDTARQEAVSYLRQHLPRATEYDEYYWYYGTLAMHHRDDDAWREWNSSLRDTLISLQRQDGPLAGSWDPRGKWAGIGGRLYSTALSTMCLEVYYRYQTISKPSGE